MDATTSPTSLRCASARAGTSRCDGHCAPLLLDHGERVPAASVGQPLHSLAPRNLFWWRHARAGARGILPAHLAPAKTTRSIPRLDRRALASATRRLRPLVVQFCLGECHLPLLPGLAKIVCTPSHPDRVGVGYDIPSLRDFKKWEISNLISNLKFQIHVKFQISKFQISNLKSDIAAPSWPIGTGRRGVYLQTMDSKQERSSPFRKPL
jgi:hypothetical protein